MELMIMMIMKPSLTSHILDKLLQFHFPLDLDTVVMKVSVEHDDGECQEEHCIRVLEVLYKVRVALAVAVSERFHESLNFLRFSLR